MYILFFILRSVTRSQTHRHCVQYRVQVRNVAVRFCEPSNRKRRRRRALVTCFTM